MVMHPIWATFFSVGFSVHKSSSIPTNNSTQCYLTMRGMRKVQHCPHPLYCKITLLRHILATLTVTSSQDVRSTQGVSYLFMWHAPPQPVRHITNSPIRCLTTVHHHSLLDTSQRFCHTRYEPQQPVRHVFNAWFTCLH